MEFEFSRNIIIGQYLPTGSFVHRLDPRTKILCSLFLLIAVTISTSIISSAVLLLAVIAIVKLSKISLGYLLRGLRAGLPLLSVFLLASLFFISARDVTGSRVFFEFGILRITQVGVQQMGLSLIRLVSLVLLTGLPSITTSNTQLTHGIELLLKPFQRFGVPAHEIALINMIALRFVPTLATELETVMKAQASRGGEIGTSRRPDKLARSLLPLIVPLFVNAFRRAEELAMAMEARGYAIGAQRTKFVVLQSRSVDVVITLGVLLFCVGLLLVHWPAVSQILSMSS